VGHAECLPEQWKTLFISQSHLEPSPLPLLIFRGILKKLPSRKIIILELTFLLVHFGWILVSLSLKSAIDKYMYLYRMAKEIYISN